MAIDNPREVFTFMLSNVRQSEERATKIQAPVAGGRRLYFSSFIDKSVSYYRRG